MSGVQTALSVSKLRIELPSGVALIDDVGLELAPGEILGLVGESGSGKTTTALSVFGYQTGGLKMTAGEVSIAGENISADDTFKGARGRLVSYVPQNPGTALNPSMRVANAIEDTIRAQRNGGREAEWSRKLLERVGLPGDPDFGERYPHQLSGGQQQRVCIAVSLAPDPAVIVLDEPTTGLDVVTQDRILKELVRLRDEHDVAMLYITHDLAVVAQIASRIAVMYAGRIVEEGPTEEILRRPRHPYTRGLLGATPDHLQPSVLESMAGIAVGAEERSAGCPFAPRCPQRRPHCEERFPPSEEAEPDHSVHCFEWRRTPPLVRAPLINETDPSSVTEGGDFILEIEDLSAEYQSRRETVVAARGISFRVEQQGCVALVGESGSGKTTIARSIAGLHPISGGRVVLEGEELPSLARNRSREQRRRVQLVFQNPAEALNPRHTVASSIARPAQVLQGMNRREREVEVERLLEAVRLPSQIGSRYPRELSGGERQRVAIARALAAAPELLICDEITSALDVSVQAVVLELLRELRRELGLAVIFISHDLGVVSTIAERLLVLEDGVMVERGETGAVLSSPEHPYTRRLLDSAPSLSGASAAWDVDRAPTG